MTLASHATGWEIGAAIIGMMACSWALGFAGGVMLRVLWWDIEPLVRRFFHVRSDKGGAG